LTLELKMTRTTKIRLLATSVGLAALFGLIAPAQAYPPMVQPSTRPMFATFGFGPSILIEPGSGTQFKITQAFGYHLFGGGEGPAIGAALEEAFGEGITRFQIGPKFWWDIQPAAGLGLYLAPTFKLGYMLATNGDSAHYFNFQFGFEVKMVLGNRGLVFFRPFTLDMGAGGVDGARFGAGYDLMFGGGVTF
jgi:hypothetical protein